MAYLMTVDWEDWFQTWAWSPRFPVSAWDRAPARLPDTTELLLRLLQEHKAAATFFMVAYNAQRYPHLVRRIAAQGHEIAVHGLFHASVATQSPDVFRREISEAKKILEDACGRKVVGYRAPNWSIGPKESWVFGILSELGFRYDASLDTLHCAAAEAARAGGIREFPRSCLRVSSAFGVPFGGGFYLRVYPFWLTRYLIERRAGDEGDAVFYVHPWELDGQAPASPRGLTCWIDKISLKSMKTKLHSLLSLYPCNSIAKTYYGA